MKKNLIFVFLVVLICGIVSSFVVNAANGDSDNVAQGNFENRDFNLIAEPTLYQQKNRERISEGEYELDSGKRIMIERNQEMVQIRSGEFIANCEDCNMTQEMVENRIKLFAQHSNGMQSEIKVMPDRASEVALARLRINQCENCSIELKEVGQGNSSKFVYQIQTKKRAKFLGLFDSKMNVGADVDADTAEVLKTRKSWWGFMASSVDETEEI